MKINPKNINPKKISLDFLENKSKINDISKGASFVKKEFEKSQSSVHMIKIFLFFIIISKLLVLSHYKANIILFDSSNITLKIKGTGIKEIFSSNELFKTWYYPNKVYINGELQNSVNYSYNLKMTENIVLLEWDYAINNSYYMFRQCSDINEIDLAKFDPTQITDMGNMFEGCSSLTSINFGNFNTSMINIFSSTFKDCSSLTSLNLSSFDTSKVTRMDDLFFGCLSLISLDLSNFDTSLVTSMKRMFMNCQSLISLNLCNFNVSKVEEMLFMFYNCSSLTSLDLSNFESSLVTIICFMFFGCINLEYINLKNFNEKNIDLNIPPFFSNIFDQVPNNIVICINETNVINTIYPQIKNKTCFINDCSDNWKKKQLKFIPENNTCVNFCDNTEYKYEYKGQCYIDCPYGSVIDENNNTICKCEKEPCLICSPIYINSNLCLKCNYDYYPIEDDPLNVGEYINCYKNPKGYYLDKTNRIYKKCYYTCETCEMEGNDMNNNCITCKENYICKYKNSMETDIYQIFNTSYNLEHSTNIKTVTSIIIQSTKNYDTSNSIYSVSTSFDEKLTESLIINNDINDTSYVINITMREEEYNSYDEFINKTEEFFTSKEYNTEILDNGFDKYKKYKKLQIIFTTLNNQINNININNITAIDLRECEILLRNSYNLSVNESLYIKKLDIIQEGMKIPKIEYDVYIKESKGQYEYLKKLSLKVCKNKKISLYVPVEINEPIDNVNSSSGFYNDICYTTKSEYGTDISLKDRRNDFIEKNKTVCQDDCDFAEYIDSIKKAKCICNVKQSSPSFSLMKIDIKKLYKNFIDIKNIANFNILVCTKQLFCKEGILKNFAFYFISIIIILHCIFIFLFYKYDFSIINKKIEDIIFGKKNFKLIKSINEKTIKEEMGKNNNIKETENNKNDNTDNKINLQNKKKSIIKKRKKIKIKRRIKKKLNKNIILDNNIINNNLIINDNNDNKEQENENSRNQIKIDKIKDIMEYNDEEINSLSYGLSLKYDKRSYIQYYVSLLKTKHDIISAFFNNKDYNSRIIKIDLFLQGFVLDYTINALFYSDDTMHQIYISEGSFDFLDQLPEIVYSSLISIVLGYALKLLALSSDDISDFKQSKFKKLLKEKGNKLIKKLKIKFILYFIISFIYLLFFWYYLSMFGAIYKNTQYYLFKDTLISLTLSLIYPFIINLLPGLFRIPSLSSDKNERELLFNFSKILQIF